MLRHPIRIVAIVEKRVQKHSLKFHLDSLEFVVVDGSSFEYQYSLIVATRERKDRSISQDIDFTKSTRRDN